MRLLDRVIQTRRDRRVADAPVDVESRVGALEQQLARLEALIEGLQDAVGRDSVRTRDELRLLRSRTEPSELARALSKDARERGL